MNIGPYTFAEFRRLMGNKRLHVVNHGKMALALFDKYNGRGIRCFVEPSRVFSDARL